MLLSYSGLDFPICKGLARKESCFLCNPKESISYFESTRTESGFPRRPQQLFCEFVSGSQELNLAFHPIRKSRFLNSNQARKNIMWISVLSAGIDFPIRKKVMTKIMRSAGMDPSSSKKRTGCRNISRTIVLRPQRLEISHFRRHTVTHARAIDAVPFPLTLCFCFLLQTHHYGRMRTNLLETINDAHYNNH